MKRVYLDNAASTEVDPHVVTAILPFLTTTYGNASSLHSFGRKAKDALEHARRIIAQKINAAPTEIVFTSGGTESNNLALKGFAYANMHKGNHIITTAIEHHSVLEPCKVLEKEGFLVTYLPVDKEGFVSLKELEKAFTSKTILVSIIHGNNEIGTVQNLEKIGALCKKQGCAFHTDACQSFTKEELDVQKSNVTLVTLNGHKIHAPKGVGALYVKAGTKLQRLHDGGNHEYGMRGGTENVAGIVGFAHAVELMQEKDIQHMKHLRDYFIDRVLREIPDTIVNGSRKLRLCNNIHCAFKYVEAESVLLHLDSYGIAVSTASACVSHALKASHVIEALKLPEGYTHGTVRITLSKYTTKEELDYALEKLKEVVQKIRELNPLVS